MGLHTIAGASPPGVLQDPSSRAVLDAIRRIVRALREASRGAERAVGVSAAQLFVLQRLIGARALSVNELAERTLTHQSSVSVVVAKLARRASSAARARVTRPPAASRSPSPPRAGRCSSARPPRRRTA